MTPNNDQLAVLRRLRTDGQISEEEFDDLARRYVDDEPADPDVDDEPDETNHDELEHVSSDDPGQEDISTDEAASNEEPALPAPSLRRNISFNYLGGLLFASFALLIVGVLGVLSWWVTIPAILVLVSTLIEGWRLVTLGGAGLVTAILMISLVASAGGSPPAEPAVVPPPTAVEDPYPPIPGSLGIYMDQVADLWNTVDAQPSINRGLTRHNEIGEYDTFIYRFDEWGRVAGAYDPDNDAIYALLVTGTFSGPATDKLHLHACFMVAQYSPECIDSFYEEGLEGGTLEDYADATHNAEWALGDHTWRLEIDQNVMTIRIYGADAA